MYTYIPSLSSLRPITLSHPYRSSPSTELSSLCYTVASRYLTHDTVYMLILLPSSLPRSVSTRLYSCSTNRLICTIFCCLTASRVKLTLGSFSRSDLLYLVYPVPSTANGPHQCHPGDDSPHQRAPGHTAGLGNDHGQHRHQLQRQLCDPTADICVPVPVLSAGPQPLTLPPTAPRDREAEKPERAREWDRREAFSAERLLRSQHESRPRLYYYRPITLKDILPQFLWHSYRKALSSAHWPEIDGDFSRPSVYFHSFQRK